MFASTVSRSYVFWAELRSCLKTSLRSSRAYSWFATLDLNASKSVERTKCLEI